MQSSAGCGALRPRRMRREGAQSRTGLAATGWREETPDGESAKEIWRPPRARSRERKAQEETFIGIVDLTRAPISRTHRKELVVRPKAENITRALTVLRRRP